MPYRVRLAGLGAGSSETDNDAPDPIPDSVKLSWQTADKVEHHQTLEVAKRIPNLAKWSGDIWFKFTSKSVEVVPLTLEQEQDLAEAQKEYP